VDDRAPTSLADRVMRFVDPDADAPIDVALLRRMGALIVVVMLGVVVPSNRLLGLPVVVDVVAAGLALAAFAIVWASRRGRHWKGLFWGLNLLGIDAAFFVSFGADGSVQGWLFPLTALTVGLFDGRLRVLALLLLGANAVAHLVVDFTRPGLIDRPASPSTRFEELVTGQIAGLLATALVVGLIASAYRREQARRAAASEALAGSLDEVRTLRGLLSICGWCKKIRTEGETWVALERYVATHTAATFTHGICPNCLDRHFGDAPEGGDEPLP
jgi:hypothetical protein